MASERTSQQAFLGVSALVFAIWAASVAVTIPCLVRVHVGDGRDADAPDGAHTWPARRAGLAEAHTVGAHGSVSASAAQAATAASFLGMWDRDDGGDDAAVPGPHAVAIPPRR